MERVTFKAITGREHETEQRVDQFVAVVGRRGGKSRSMATLATYIACCAITRTRWCRASAACCYALHLISGWHIRRSSSPIFTGRAHTAG